MTQKQSSQTRQVQLIEAAVTVASRPGGWATLTRSAVAEQAGCSDALVSQQFGTMEQFKRRLMRHAIKAKCLPIIAQGIAMGDRNALKVPDELSRKALATLSA